MTPTAEPVAWVLNLDAEDELAHARAHTPSAAVLRRLEALLPVLTAPGGLVRPGDQLVFPGRAPVDAGLTARAWCPTRWARARFARAGLADPGGPGDAVLRAVNHRAFCAALGDTLPGATFVTSGAALERALERTELLAAVSTARAWLLKRPWGYAGRGRRTLRGPALTADDRRWLDASLRGGEGLQVEPLVEREADFALHGWAHGDGAVTWGQPTGQRVDDAGQWLASAPAGEALQPPEREALLAAGAQTARALHAAGYAGPFGLDAFRWVDAGGRRHFRPRCEVNARFSMGWATGLQGAPLR